MIAYVTPDAIVDAVTNVTLELLRGWKIQGVALDLDNTIVPWHTDKLEPGIAPWVTSVRAAGIRMCLLTNNYGPQAKSVARELDMPLVRGALKPLPAAFRRCLDELQTDASQSVCVGDQLFTDVLGAKLVGMRAVYVRPIAQRAFVTTRFLRWLERPVLARLRNETTQGGGT